MNVVSTQTRSANSEVCKQGFDVNAVPVDDGASTVRSLSPSSMQLAEVPWLHAVEQEASEDEENGGGRVRKKLRLSKEQSAFLEDSFKEHSTLTLEQKSNIANRLSLRPRQVEVWFQNRRARTKLKQTETDCEYLKRSCQTLTLENRRLQREVAELRAFRPTYPLYNHHLYGARACPSCDNKATTYTNPLLVATAAAVSSPGQGASPPSAMPTLFSSRPRFGPFTTTASHPVLRRQPSATS
jgi:homeobox-leucine zipper protein